uniref:Uncharacterized protein n=1 Tax=Oryzias latipes TaxID=8090 RepID=A0A3P9LAT0_ORYLA
MTLSNRSVVGKFLQEVRLVASDRRSWRILLFGALNLLCTGCLLMWCSSTNSMGKHTHTHAGRVTSLTGRTRDKMSTLSTSYYIKSSSDPVCFPAAELVIK